MNAQTPVQRLTVLTSVASCLTVGLLIAGESLDANSAAQTLLMAFGVFVLLATVGFAWSLATASIAARRLRKQSRTGSSQGVRNGVRTILCSRRQIRG